MDSYQKGLWFECLAMLWLLLKGYRIVAWRYKTPMGEIDCLVRKRDCLVAVEVKTRANMDDAAFAITPKNKRRTQNALRHFLATHKGLSGYALRFDAVIFSGWFRGKHIQDAWQTEHAHGTL